MMLSETEYQKVVIDWNNTLEEFPDDICLPELFEEQVVKSPDAVAVIFSEDDYKTQHSLTYQQLNDKANQLANYLRSKGVKPDSVVTIIMKRSPEMLIAALGALKAGGAYAPIDPYYPEERVAFMLEDTKSPIIITQQQLFAKLADFAGHVICLDTDWEEIGQESSTPPRQQASPDNLAYVIYTSGSTGKPKGVAMEHRPLVNLLTWQLQRTTCAAGSPTLQFASLSFDVSFQEVFSTWCSGGILVLINEELRRDSAKLLQLIEKQAIERLFLPFVALQGIAEAADHSHVYPSSLKEIITAGEQLQLNRYINKFFTLLPGCTLDNQYGPSETHVVTAFQVPTSAYGQMSLPPIGRPIANGKIYILDPHLGPVALGDIGELYLGGIALARGYLNRPQLTAERFIDNPFSEDVTERIYKTGDLACYLPDGNIEFLGRIDDQLKIRGFRVELGEIETTLASHTSVGQAIVVAHGDDYGNKRLVAYLTDKTNQLVPTTDLRQFLLDQLPDYMVPSLFIIIPEMPKTASGKIDRKALPAPSEQRPELGQEYIAPKTTTELRLADIWGKVLKIDRVGLDDNFFELGGDSLMATRLVYEIQKSFQLTDLAVSKLFQFSTISSLAQYLAKEHDDRHSQPQKYPVKEQPVDSALRTDGEMELLVPISEAQREIWQSIHLSPEANCAFNASLWLDLVGTLDVPALETAMQGVVDRHDALRTTFSSDGKSNCIHSVFPHGLLHTDLHHLSQEKQHETMHQIEAEVANSPFDLVHGPLLRTQLVKLQDDQHRLLITVHHLICDGWSFQVFLEDLATLYDAGKQNTSPALSPAFQFSQYVRESNDSQQTDQAVADLEYWLEIFKSVPDPMEFPSYGPRSLERIITSKRKDCVLDFSLVAGLKQLSGKLNVTYMTLLLAALSAYLQRICRQDDIVIGVPAAGQAVSGRYQLIGHCVNLLPLRCQVDADMKFSDYVKRCQDIFTASYEHQQVTYGTLLQQLKLSRDPGRPPLVSIIFNIDQKMDDISFNDLDTKVSIPPRAFENFELFLNIAQNKDGSVIQCQYRTPLFDEDVVTTYLLGFIELLSAVVNEPEKLLKNLSVVASQEQRILLEQYNNTALTLPNVNSFIELFREVVGNNEDKVAAVFADKSFSYAELDQRSDQLAAKIKSLLPGDEEESLVGIYLNRSLHMLVATLAVLKAGAGYVPLDPAYPKDRLQYMIDDSQLSLLITENSLSVDHFSYTAQVINIEADWSDITTCDVATIQGNSFASESIGYVIYTSGSTGKPKGVAVPHRAILNFLVSMQVTPGICSEDTLLAVTTLSFDIAVLELYLPLITGATVVIASGEDVVDGGRLLRLIDNAKITFLQATPSTWRILQAAGWQGSPELKALCGGEAFPQDLAAKLVGKVKELWNMYGPTETTVWSTVHRISGENEKILIGRPIGNTELYVLDENQQLLPRGVPGELYIGGAGVTKGYMNREKLTTDCFVANPYASDPQDTIYRTGDLVRYHANGDLEYISRLDNQVKLRGYRIELGEIESAIGKFIGVKEVVVNIYSIAEDDQRLVAYIRPENDISLDALKSEIRKILPNYMMPQHYMMLDEFPQTANGKIDRKGLPRPLLEEKIASDQVKLCNDFERSLLAVWRQVLEVPSFGVTDNFFEMGGHSLLAMTLVNEMKKATGVEIEYGSIFTASTVRDLVDSLGTATRKQASSIVPLQSKGLQIPLFCLCGINLYKELALSLGDQQPVYAIYADEEQALLEQAVKGVVADVSVEKLANVYCKAIRRQQPTGPYQLAGISFGGLLAIETAKLLQKEGEKVILVVLLDTILHQGKIKSRLGMLKHHYKKIRGKGVELFGSNIVKRLMKMTDGPQLMLPENSDNDDASVRVRELAYLQAMDEYEKDMKFYDGDVLLFRAKNDDVGGRVNYLPDYGWGNFLLGDFTMFDVPGDHLGIIQQPNVQVLAGKLQPFLSAMSLSKDMD